MSRISHENLNPRESVSVRSLALLFSTLLWLLPAFATSQPNMVTNRNDNGRTGLNPNETLLTPQNVNKNQFGKLFSRSVDGYIVGQPLYLPNLTIGGKQHNVVFVATLHDSVYAFDANRNTGTDAAPLWQVNFTNPGAGITTATDAFLPCPGVHRFPESGIVSTPVIDPAAGTLYVVAKTNENGTVFHRLHALDVTTGAERPNSPVPINATFTTNSGTVLQVNNLHQMNRPALLLSNGVVYVAMGSNGCNDSNNSWVIGYDANTLSQKGAFVAAPEHGLGSIWQSGAGPASDATGNIYASTAEAEFDANTGGQDFGSSILKLTPSGTDLNLKDYFTPFNEATISLNDLDLSAAGVLALPDQPGAHPHLLVATGKQGRVYLLDRDNMGQFNPINNGQIVQELQSSVGEMFSTPAYWNGKVYFNGKSKPIMAFALTNGILSSTASFKSAQSQAGSHAPTISANGNSNGILWTIPGGQLNAFNASNLALLYTSKQAGTRDLLPALAHFASQTVVNGRVYVGTRNSLEVFGLLSTIVVSGGNNQTVTVAHRLPNPLSVKVTDAYTGVGAAGITVAFSDGGTGGTFSDANPVTDASGVASTNYTFGTKARTITITASSPGLSGASFTETGIADQPKWIVIKSGNNQTAPTNTQLAAPLAVKVVDQYSNPVSGIPVTFSDGTAGGMLSASVVNTDSTGTASVTYKTGSTAGTANVTATITGKTPVKFVVTVTSP